MHKLGEEPRRPSEDGKGPVPTRILFSGGARCPCPATPATARSRRAGKGTRQQPGLGGSDTAAEVLPPGRNRTRLRPGTRPRPGRPAVPRPPPSPPRSALRLCPPTRWRPRAPRASPAAPIGCGSRSAAQPRPLRAGWMRRGSVTSGRPLTFALRPARRFRPAPRAPPAAGAVPVPIPIPVPIPGTLPTPRFPLAAAPGR